MWSFQDSFFKSLLYCTGIVSWHSYYSDYADFVLQDNIKSELLHWKPARDELIWANLKKTPDF